LTFSLALGAKIFEKNAKRQMQFFFAKLQTLNVNINFSVIIVFPERMEITKKPK
jgi:hypothetical protein